MSTAPPGQPLRHGCDTVSGHNRFSGVLFLGPQDRDTIWAYCSCTYAGTGQSASVEERPEDILEGASVSEEAESEGGDVAEDANFGFSPDAVARFYQGYQHNEAVARKAMRTTAVSVLACRLNCA